MDGPMPSLPPGFTDAAVRVLALLTRAHVEPQARPALAWSAEVSERLRQPQPLPAAGTDLPDVLQAAGHLVLDGYCNVAHPLYFGYISPRPHPAAVLGDLLASGLNQTPGAWRAGPAATAIEVETLGWVCELLGYPRATSGLPNGIFTGGGTVANLAALKLARDRYVRTAIGTLATATVYMSREGHFSIGKSLDVLGFAPGALRLIDTDAHGCIDVAALERQLDTDVRDGLHPIALVAVAGTSATAAVDPLDTLADLAQARGLWFHVDGAAGAAYAALPRTAPLFQGLARADSVTLDPCKWMFVSFGMGCLLVRDGALLRDAFWSTGHYWEELDELDTFKMNLYGTRQWRSLGLWTLLRHLGLAGYRELLDHMLASAQHLAALIKADDRYELLAHPELPVLAFRLADDPDSQRTHRVQRRLVADGQCYVTVLDWRGEQYVRVAVNNYATTCDDMTRFKHLLDEAEAIERAEVSEAVPV